ncbi:MAG: hypothetical protein WCQ48_00450 [Chloroflexota bacterium]
MDWRALVAAAERTDLEAERRYSGRYRDYLLRRDDDAWWSAAGPSFDEANALLTFLNKWGSRMTQNQAKGGDATVDYLCRTGARAAGLLKEFRSVSLLDVTLDSATRGAIASALDAFSDGPRTYTTGGAKALHMMNRALFPMWDDAIRVGYGLKGARGKDYADLFLPHMQAEIAEALRTFVADREASEGAAEHALETRCGRQWYRPLAKVADEFNYWAFTQPVGGKK